MKLPMAWIQNIAKLFGYLVLLAPLVVYTGVQFPFTIPRFAYLLGTVSVFMLASLVLSFKESRVRLSKIDFFITAFIGLLCLSLFITTDVRQTMWSGAARTTGLSLYLVWFFWYASLRTVDARILEWKKILAVSFGVAAAASIWSLFDAYVLKGSGIGSPGRLNLPAGNALILATYLAPYLFLGSFLIAERATFRWTKYQVIAIVVGLVPILTAMMLTLSRSSYVGVGAGAAIAVLGFLVMKKKTVSGYLFFRLIASISVAALILIGIFFWYSQQEGVTGRLSLKRDAFATLETRFLNWKIAARVIKQNPVFGVGWENYRTAVDKNFDASLANYSYYETRIDKPHNVLLEIWATLGTVGLALYLGLVGVTCFVIVLAYKKNKLSLEGLWIFVGFLVAYQVQNLFAFDTPQSLMTLGVMLAYAAYLDGNEYEFDGAWIIPLKKIVFVLCAVLFSWMFVYGGVRSFVAMRDINEGLVASQNNDFKKLDAVATRALSAPQSPYYFETWRWFAESLLKKYAAGTAKLSDLSPDERARWEAHVATIAGLTKKYGDAYPESFEWQTFAGKVAYFTALATKNPEHLLLSEKYFLNAYAISMARQEPPVLLGYVYEYLGDNKKAVQWYGTAIELTASAEVLQLRDWLIERFVKQGDNGSIVLLLEKTVEITPNAETFARLAAAYAELKRFDDARRAVNRAVEIDPSFSAEAASFIATFPKK